MMFVPLFTEFPTRFPERSEGRPGSDMSLKWFHIVFISLSMLVSLGFGVWGLFNQHVALGVASLGGIGRPDCLRKLFPRRKRGSSAYDEAGRDDDDDVGIAWGAPARPGVPRVLRQRRLGADERRPGGHHRAALVTVAVLASIAGFFFIYLRRRIRMFEESNGGSY